MDQATRLSTAFALTGVSLEAHLTELPRLRHGQRVKIGGVFVARQHPPTAKGFAYLALEDPGRMVNVVIAPDVYARDRAALRGPAQLFLGDGEETAPSQSKHRYRLAGEPWRCLMLSNVPGCRDSCNPN